MERDRFDHCLKSLGFTSEAFRKLSDSLPATECHDSREELIFGGARWERNHIVERLKAKLVRAQGYRDRLSDDYVTRGGRTPIPQFFEYVRERADVEIETLKSLIAELEQ